MKINFRFPNKLYIFISHHRGILVTLLKLRCTEAYIAIIMKIKEHTAFIHSENRHVNRLLLSEPRHCCFVIWGLAKCMISS